VLFCRWCRALLPHLEESKILEHFILAFVWLLITYLSFSFVSFLFLFSLNWLLVSVVNALIKGEIEDRWMVAPGCDE
jgi:hypothetical protein